MICESYYEAIRSASPSRIEAIDMGRRGIHNEGSQTLMDRLERQDRGRFRHRPAPVHAGLRALLARLTAMEPLVEAGAGRQAPGAILFMCGMNAIRSPMAEVIARSMLPANVYIKSAGVRAGERDPFVDVALEEIGLSLGRHHPHTLEELEDDYFDLDHHALAASAPRRAGADTRQTPSKSFTGRPWIRPSFRAHASRFWTAYRGSP